MINNRRSPWFDGPLFLASSASIHNLMIDKAVVAVYKFKKYIYEEEEFISCTS